MLVISCVDLWEQQQRDMEITRVLRGCKGWKWEKQYWMTGNKCDPTTSYEWLNVPSLTSVPFIINTWYFKERKKLHEMKLVL